MVARSVLRAESTRWLLNPAGAEKRIMSPFRVLFRAPSDPRMKIRSCPDATGDLRFHGSRGQNPVKLAIDDFDLRRERCL